MSWGFYSEDKKNDFVAQVTDSGLIGLFEADYIQIQALKIPFYQNGEFLLMENLNVAPPFTMEYIAAGHNDQDIVYLDGTSEPFRILNQKGHLLLNDETVIDYLEFFCFSVNQRPQNILLLRNPEQMPYQDTIYLDFHFDKNNYGADDIKLSRNPDQNGYIVHAPFVFAGKIDLGIATISDSGDIHIERSNPR
ncbi:MAG: hypothetical protein ACK4VI_06940 [Alphaproteobacteria bacterium]